MGATDVLVACCIAFIFFEKSKLNPIHQIIGEYQAIYDGELP